jgi:hypothetical protein
MNANKEIDTTIPAFLKRLKDNSLPVAKAKKRAKTSSAAVTTAEPDVIETILSSMEPATRAAIEREIAAGRFRRSWLTDRSTLRLFEQAITDQQRKREDGFARLLAMKDGAPSVPKMQKPTFGVGVYIKALASNPRKEGTRAWRAYAEMETFLEKDPGASVDRILASTSYRRDDFSWDLERGAIVTDVVAPAKLAFVTPKKAAAKVAKKVQSKKRGKKS